MKVFRNTYEYNIENSYVLNFDIEKAVFFDIETTGFSAEYTKLYLIGCLYYDKEAGNFKTIQWFSDRIEDEKNIIIAFFDFIRKFKFILHFNGEGFDMPYIMNKCKICGISESFSGIQSIDMYKMAYSLRKLLKTPDLKQKTIEKFLGINREDKYSGKELIKVYETYIKNHDDASMALLTLHNLDDIKGLLNLLPIFAYDYLVKGHYDVHTISVENKDTIIELKLHCPLPVRISASNSFYYFTAFNSVCRIKISIYTDELKYFYPNYKDYYYLPSEDCSIHKSVAFYLDKDFKTQAKAANCYSKKTGHFLPQAENIISPYFKIEYHDKISYFEVTDDFLKNPSDIKAYAKHIISQLV